MNKLLKILLSCCALTLLFISVARGGTTVLAAASLKEALDEVDGAYLKRGGEKATIAYAASSALAKQVQSGAPADIFISADLDWMDYLELRKLLKAGTRVNLLRNQLVLIAPAGNQSSIAIEPGFPLAQALGGGRLAMADPDGVPSGKYGKAALEKLDVWPSVADKVARGENVRAALSFVSRGEAPFGIVYRTDAAADPKVRIVGAFPEGSHPAIVYPAAMLAGGKSPVAEKFFAFLRSPEAAAIFRKHGFLPY